jgi:hypothetical protein
MKLLIMQCSPTFSHFLPLTFKYSIQHPALGHSQYISFPYFMLKYLYYATAEKLWGGALFKAVPSSTNPAKFKLPPGNLILELTKAAESRLIIVDNCGRCELSRQTTVRFSY